MRWMRNELYETAMKRFRINVRNVPQKMIIICEYVILAISFSMATEVVAGGVLDCVVIWLDAMLAVPLLIRMVRMKQKWQRNRSAKWDNYCFFVIEMMVLALCLLLMKTSCFRNIERSLLHLMMAASLIWKSGTTGIVMCTAYKNNYNKLYIFGKLLIINIIMSLLLWLAIILTGRTSL